MDKKFISKIKQIAVRILRVKIFNQILKIILRPLAVLGLISKETALNIPAMGRIEVIFSEQSKFYLMNNGKDRVANALFWLGKKGYEFETTNPWAEYARTSKTIFDVGAYNGLYALIASASNPSAKIYAFEAFEETFKTLQANITINHFNNIVPVHSIISNTNGPTRLNIPHYVLLPQSPTIMDDFNAREKNHSIMLASQTLDRFIEEKRITKLDLIKIDVESAEPLVLEGMRNTLKASQPVIFIEVLYGKTEEFLNNYFKGTGYQYFWLTDQGPVKKGIITGDPEKRFLNYLLRKESI